MLRILAPGFQTTVQDVGRKHGQSMGIPPSGAQDTFSLRAANLLVGNPAGGPLFLREDPGAAGLEILLGGVKLTTDVDVVLALTGADIPAAIDGDPVPSWQSFILRAGQTLALGMAKAGARGYLAVHGGIAVPVVMGSRATHLGGQFGGFKGRKLAAGDGLAVGSARADPGHLSGRLFEPTLRAKIGAPWEIRVIEGPETHHFTADSVETFYSTDWKLNPKADRTGMRFIGPQLSFKPGRPAYLVEEAGADFSNIVIDPGAPVGTIQVPSGVEPIVLAIDSPTIGGYARIACVISLDMARLGQTRPLDSVRFVRTTPEQAVAWIREQETILQETALRAAA